MPAFYRYINSSERKQLWSPLLVLSTLIIVSWYYIKTIQSDSECYRILKRDYPFPSPYIDVPDVCPWWTIFWLRVNRYKIYTTFPFFTYTMFEYYISAYHLFGYGSMFAPLLFNASRAEDQDNIYYRDAPYLLLALLMVLYLEKEPFDFYDEKLFKRRDDIDIENSERLIALQEADSRCWREAICNIRQCDNIVDVKQILRQADEQIEKNLWIYELLDKPKWPPLERKKTNILLNIFIYVLSFLLVTISVWSYIFVFTGLSFRRFSGGNVTRIL